MKNRFGNREVLCDGIGGVNSPAGGFNVNNVNHRDVASLPGAEVISKIGEIMSNVGTGKSLSALTSDAAREFAQAGA